MNELLVLYEQKRMAHEIFKNNDFVDGGDPLTTV